MPEKAINKKINRAKKSAYDILSKAGFQIEIASNKIYCIDAYRKSEHRIIGIGIEEIMKSQWFKAQIRKLEKLPNPAPGVTSKEIWIRKKGEHNFQQYSYENGQWLNEDSEKVEIFNS